MSSAAVKEAVKSPYGGEKTWSQYMTDIYHGRKPPTIGTLYMDELEQKAKEKLKGYPSKYSNLDVFQQQAKFSQTRSCMFSPARATVRQTSPIEKN